MVCILTVTSYTIESVTERLSNYPYDWQIASDVPGLSVFSPLIIRIIYDSIVSHPSGQQGAYKYKIINGSKKKVFLMTMKHFRNINFTRAFVSRIGITVILMHIA